MNAMTVLQNIANNMLATLIITAYCLTGTMANGEKVHQHSIACPRAWKEGTKVEILKKEYVCHDKLGPQYKRGRIDIWMPKCSDARKWGKKKLTINIKQNDYKKN